MTEYGKGLASSRLEKINRTLLRISGDIGSCETLEQLFPAIHRSLSELIDTTNFYIALYDEASDTVHFPYNVDVTELEGCEPLVGATPEDSLTVRVMRMRSPLLITKNQILEERSAGKEVFRGALPEIWLGVPLVDRDKLIGAMVVQSYEAPTYYDWTDAEVLSGVAAQVAMAIERKRLEVQLVDSVNRFRRIVDDVEQIAIQGYDERRRVTFWNRASEQLYGYSREEALGRKLEELIIPDEMREEVITAVENWLRHGQHIPPSELVLRDKDNQPVPVFSSHVMNQVGGGWELFCIDHDLRPIKEAENALRRANEQFSIAMDAIDAEVYVADMETGELLYLNTQTTRATGARIGDICWQALQIGQTGPCPFCTNHKLIDENGQPGAPYIWEVKNSKNGRWYQCRDRAIQWPDGRIVRLEIAVDITDRKRGEQALAEAVDRYRSLLGAMHDALFVCSLDDGQWGHIIEVNQIACDRYGYTREEFQNIGFRDLSVRWEEDRKQLESILVAERDTGQHIFETEHRRRSGESFPVEISANFFEQSGVRHILMVVRDIGSRKQAEREREAMEARLSQAQKMESIGRLAGGVAHDFNNMLNVILGRAELVLDDVDETFAYREDLEEIRLAAHRSADLTRQLLSFARKQSVSPRIVDLNGRVAEILDMLHRLLGEKIEVVWRPGFDLHPVSIDPVQIDQILTNLCLNARDAMDGSGRIVISLTNFSLESGQVIRNELVSAGEYICISVSDDGCGMDEEVLENLFEPFFTTKEVGSGTGLGLATLYGIVRQNNGFVDVESTPGVGSVFRVFLPAERGLPPVEPVEIGGREEQTIVGETGNRMILLVEDEENLLLLTATLLRRAGYRVVGYQTPAEAIDYVRKTGSSIDLLLTDIVMPGMDGPELAHIITGMRPAIKVLYMTGYSEKELDRVHGICRTDVLQKPFTGKVLAANVQRVLAGPENQEKSS